MNSQYKKIIGLFSRYLIILALGISNLYIIYATLTPITLHSTNLALKVFGQSSLSGNTIHFNSISIQLIPACIAGSAFYLLLFLLLSTGNISPKIRLRAIMFSVITLFLANISRIVILAFLARSPSFEFYHWVFWHILSTILVVTIYLITLRRYKIKSVPIVTDMKYLKSLSRAKKIKQK